MTERHTSRYDAALRALVVLTAPSPAVWGRCGSGYRAKVCEASVRLLDAAAGMRKHHLDADREYQLTVAEHFSRTAGLVAFFDTPRDRAEFRVAQQAAKVTFLMERAVTRRPGPTTK